MATPAHLFQTAWVGTTDDRAGARRSTTRSPEPLPVEPSTCDARRSTGPQAQAVHRRAKGDAVQAKDLFVKPNVRIEGLVDSFVVWLHTGAPVAGAMNLANLHLPMLDSFVEDPHAHARAVADPAMKGGFFLNVGSDRVDEVRDLRKRSADASGSALALAKAIGEAEDLLRAEATGYAMTNLYPRLSSELQGFVELTYDLDHRPSLRFMEAMLYRTELAREHRQSVDLSLDDGSEPPFVLSTPRLPAEGHLQAPVPLKDPAIDEFIANRAPRSLAQFQDLLEVPDDQLSTLRSLLTSDQTDVPARHIDRSGRIRYFGHACILLQSPQVSILTDPFISSNVAAGDRFTYADLPDHIDYVLITHGHQDHVVVETLLRIRHQVGTVVVPRSGSGQRQDPSIRLFLENLGFTVVEMDDLDEVTFPGGSIVLTPFLAEHCDLDIRAKSTYWVNIAGRKIFVGADSSGVDRHLYARIRRVLGQADMAFVGMECDGAPLTWLYRPLFTQPVPRRIASTRKLSGSNAAQALGIIEELGIKQAVVYAMGEESWLQHVMATTYTPDCYQLQQVAEFLELCADRGVEAEHPTVQREWHW
jgi:L-ascorbate metabolism protein UlaG (beta-lactamase superfamily)